MVRDPDPDSRPISVAELLRRAREDDAAASDDGDTEAASPHRRRRGRSGSFSVAELTGEIPRVRPDDPAPDSGTESDRGELDPEPPGSSQPRVAGQTPAEVERAVPAVGEEHADHETDPTRQADTESTRLDAIPDAREDTAPVDTRATAVFPRSDEPVAPTETDDRFPVADGPDRPLRNLDTPPGTRDFSADRVSERMRRRADSDAETGVIPRVDDPGAVAAGGEQSFDSYRNFDDVAADPVPQERKVGGLRGWLARRSVKRQMAREHAEPGIDRTEHDGSDHGGGDALAPTETAPFDAPHADAPVQGLSVYQRPTPDVDEGDDRGSVHDADPTTVFPAAAAAGGVGAVAAGTAAARRDTDDDPDADDNHTHDPDAQADSPTGLDPHAPTGHVGAGTTGVDTTEPNRIDDGASDPTRHGDPHADASAHVAGPRGAQPTGERSPAVQWLALIAQVIVGLAIGVGLFWGFTELWRWNVYFALVLAVVVIFGLVTLVHVVRRKQDLVSTLLALGVGLIVTIGPLVLLASGD
ncbi:hypothetical protein [Williamsia sterculiae]|uniref:Uncharacterized protein n=1 Tax=Williamsia sterculiae TaxID=1344003 RepID=A0A1N7CVJ7_9NOCA|nr:hypothetical protein [Williamsia sterculiae]SIR67688.1 hypothetical protein SAMN05445060_0396 [Williamsia sterculiae]